MGNRGAHGERGASWGWDITAVLHLHVFLATARAPRETVAELRELTELKGSSMRGHRAHGNESP